MPLNKPVLKAAVEAALKASSAAAQATPPPDEDALVSDLAQALANAIDAFVRGGVVSGIQTDVTLDTLNGNPANGSGTGAQVGTAAVH